MTRIVRTEKLHLEYKRNEGGRETPIAKIVQSSQKLNNLYYTPYLWAWNHYLQCSCFAPYDYFMENFSFMHLQFEKEELTLSDGGAINLCWHKSKPDPKALDRPILAIVGGLNGTVYTGYNQSVIRLANE